MTTSPSFLPSAIGLSRLRVYDTVGPDGQRGGTPHVHFLCTELYFVLQGQGSVEMIDGHGFRSVQIVPNSALVFSPGTLHRLINPDSNLEILVLMQNSGLPEHGDNVVCFTEEWLATDDAYQSAMRVTSLEDAYQRRDRGVEGFLAIKAQFDQSLAAGQTALNRFFELAYQRTAHLRPQWEQIIHTGAAQSVAQSLSQLYTVSHLMESQQVFIQPTTTEQLGFCGHLQRYFNPATVTLEGLLPS